MWILNTKTGILHTKACADGLLKYEPVAPGRRKHYSNLIGINDDPHFVGVHSGCMQK